MTERQTKPGRIVTWAMLIGSLTVVAGFAGLTAYLYPCADDYSFAVNVTQNGFWGAQAKWYMTWTGRFASSAILSGTSGRAAMDHYWIWSLSLFVLFAMATYRLAAGVFGDRLDRPGRLAVSLGVMALYLGTMPSPCEGFYWMAGALTYQGGNAVAMLVAATIISRRQATGGPTGGARKVGWLAACGLMGLVVSGFNETLTVLLVVLTATGLAVSWRRKLPSCPGWLAALLGCLAGAAIMFLAPGNTERQAHFLDAHQFGPSLYNTLCLSGKIAGGWLLCPPVAAGALLWVGFVVRSGRFATWGRGWILIGVIVVGAGMLGLTLFPAFWAMGSVPPPPRVCNQTHFVLMLASLAALTVLGACLGRWSAARRLVSGWTGAIGGAVLAIVFLGGFQWLDNVGQMKTIHKWQGSSFARQMESRRAIIEECQGQDVVLPPLIWCPPMLMFSDIASDADSWHNRHFAAYWHLRSVRLADGSP